MHGLNLRGHAPKACGWPLPYTRNLWWLVTELNCVHRLFRPALYRRVHEPKSGGPCETRTRIARVQAVGTLASQRELNPSLLIDSQATSTPSRTKPKSVRVG